MIRNGLSQRFLGILCLARTMIPAFVTQDETWVHHFDPESKMHLTYNGSILAHPLLRNFKMVHSAGKVMDSVFWDSQGVIMIDILAT